MATKARNEDWHAPDRDALGRFRAGKSGNPNGRPRKPPERPWNLGGSIAEALDEEVPVTEGGVTSYQKMRDLVVRSLVRGLVKAKPRDMIHILDRLSSLGALEPVTEPEERWTDEDERILEEVKRMLELEAPDVSEAGDGEG